MMKTVSIYTFEDIHHTCLLFGLKQTFLRFPFLVKNPMITPPPFMRNPKKPLLFVGKRLSPVSVQYYRKDITVLYDETLVSDNEAFEFSKAVMEEYLHLRHPLMKYMVNEDTFLESTGGHIIAQIKSSAC